MHGWRLLVLQGLMFAVCTQLAQTCVVVAATLPPRSFVAIYCEPLLWRMHLHCLWVLCAHATHAVHAWLLVLQDLMFAVCTQLAQMCVVVAASLPPRPFVGSSCAPPCGRTISGRCLGSRTYNKQLEFLVKWVGHSTKLNDLTWSGKDELATHKGGKEAFIRYRNQCGHAWPPKRQE